jgi:hypothetical protein
MEVLGGNMEKPTKKTDKNQKKNVSKIPTKKNPRATKDLTAAFKEEWEDWDPEEEVNAKRKKKIRQTEAAKKIIGDPWATVPHTLLSSRKIAAGSKIKSKSIQIKKITTIKTFSTKKLDLSVGTTPLTRRKAKQIDLLSQTLSQIIGRTLKDYNSINFRIRAS